MVDSVLPVHVLPEVSPWVSTWIVCVSQSYQVAVYTLMNLCRGMYSIAGAFSGLIAVGNE